VALRPQSGGQNRGPTSEFRVNHPGLRMQKVGECLGKQLFGSIGGTDRREQEGDRGSCRVTRSIQVEPVAFDPHLRLVHAPGFVCRFHNTETDDGSASQRIIAIPQRTRVR